MTYRLEKMGQEKYTGLTVVNPKGDRHFNGVVKCHESELATPLRWKKPRRIFVCSMSDLFHKDVPFEFVDKMFAVMALCPHHTFQVLTKRPERMEEYLNGARCIRAKREGSNVIEHMPAPLVMADIMSGGGMCPEVSDWPLHNVWLGTSVEDQQRADERWEAFRACPAAVKFVSYEPALGPVDWIGWEFVDQIIGGGESGPKARPSHPDWHRKTRDFCTANGIAYFFKQVGEWSWDNTSSDNRAVVGIDGSWTRGLPFGYGNDFPRCQELWRVGKKASGRLLDGRTWDEFPAVVVPA